MEEPVPADPPRIFWKSRRSGACCSQSIPVPATCIQNLTDFKCLFFLPPQESSSHHVSSSISLFLEDGQFQLSFLQISL